MSEGSGTAASFTAQRLRRRSVAAQGLRRHHGAEGSPPYVAAVSAWARSLLSRALEFIPMKSAPPSDDLPCDLLDFLAQERGLEVEVAAELLGDFLMQYEPRSAASRSLASLLAA
jgi:hypothetical protein